jgi:mannose-6-phosphate isomerase-like protein (cupin superfamily)
MKKSILLPYALFAAITIVGCNNNKPVSTATKNPTTSIPNDELTKTTNNMKGFKIDIQKATSANKNFREVLYTGKHLQLVLMTLKPGEEIGLETHTNIDQFFRFESGHGKCVVNGNEYVIKDGDVIIVPSGAPHNVINTDKKSDLKMYTIYAAPNHKDGTVHVTKKDAQEQKEHFDGKTTE